MFIFSCALLFPHLLFSQFLCWLSSATIFCAMAASSSSVVASLHWLVPPASLIVSDVQLDSDGVLVVSTFLLWCLFKYHGVSQEWFTTSQQYPAGVSLSVSALTLHHLIDYFPIITCTYFDDLACSHSVLVKVSDM